MPEVEDGYVESGDVKVVWRDNPLENLHPWSKEAAIAMECSYREGGNEAFWGILDRVYMNQDSLDQENVQDEIIGYAENYDIGEQEMESCISDYDVEEEVESDKEMSENHDISGTPTTLINGEEIVGAKPFSQFESIIESRLEGDSESDENEEDSEELEEYESDPVLGDEDAEVTMTVYEDFQCPFCKRLEDGAMDEIEENYVETGKVKIVWKDRPLPELHPWAKPAAETMECVFREEEEAFWEVKDRIFNNQNQLSTSNVQDTIKDWAEDEGVSKESVETCLVEENPMGEVKADIEEAEMKGASGTPTSFIRNKKLVGAQPYSRFEEVIEAKLDGEELPDNVGAERDENEEGGEETQDSGPDASQLQERLNKSQKNITALEERLEKQQAEIKELEKQQNAIESILDSILKMLGV
jgi:protein-disulfide isomerase